MSRMIKIVLSIISVIVLLLVIAVIVLPQIIDPNDYKPQIAEAVKKHTGRNIEIEGKLGLSIFPWLGAEAGKLSLTNAPGFGDAPFAKIDRAQFKVKLIPLLSKKVEVKRIILKGLRLNLAKNENGVSNWDDLISESTATKDTQKKDPQSSPQDIGIAAIALGGVTVQDANITWDDRQNGQRIDVIDLNFLMDQLSFDAPNDFSLNFTVENRQPKLTEKIDMTGSLTVNRSLDQFELKQVKINSGTEGADIPGKFLHTELNMDADLDLTNQTADISALEFNVKNLTLAANLEGENILDAPVIKGPVNIVEFNPRGLLKSLSMEIPETRDPSVLKKLKATLRVQASKNTLSLTDMTIELDDTTLAGNAEIVDFANPAITFDLDINQIDADRYLPPAVDENAQPVTENPPDEAENKEKTPLASPSTAAASAAAELPLEMLRNLDVNGTIKIGELTISGAKARGIEINLTGKNGIIDSAQSIDRLYQGKYKGKMRLDARRPVPSISLNETLTNLNIEPLLIDTTGKAPMSGTAQLTADLTGSGLNPDAIKSSLNGTVNALFTDGAVNGINVIELIRSVRTKLKGKPTEATDAADKTEFSELKFAATVDNGLVNNHELDLKSPLLRIGGSGNINLNDEKIDYQVIAKLVSSLDGQGGPEVNDLRGIPIAVDINGTLSKLSFKPNLAAMLQEEQKALLQEKKEKLNTKVEEKKQRLIEKLDKKIGPGTGELLDKLFK